MARNNLGSARVCPGLQTPMGWIGMLMTILDNHLSSAPAWHCNGISLKKGVAVSMRIVWQVSICWSLGGLTVTIVSVYCTVLYQFLYSFTKYTFVTTILTSSFVICFNISCHRKHKKRPNADSTKLAHRLQCYIISIDPQHYSKNKFAQLFLSCMLNYASIMYNLPQTFFFVYLWPFYDDVYLVMLFLASCLLGSLVKKLCWLWTNT